MNDARVDRLARLLVDYSLQVKEGDVFAIDAPAVAAPLVRSVYRAGLAAGALPYASTRVDGLEEILFDQATKEQLGYIHRHERDLGDVDSWLTVAASTNTRASLSVDPDAQTNFFAARAALRRQRLARIESHELSWCATFFPTVGHAQDAGMTLSSYEDFAFRACHVTDDTDDAVDHWRRFGEEARARIARLEEVSELRLVGEDTELSLRIGGRRWSIGEGRYNMPDGEIATAPLEQSAEGEIRFRPLTIFAGREFEDVRLRFEQGEVVAVEALRGGDFLQKLLELPGARRIGEVAFGLNYEIGRPTGHILFDEKIGGTLHLALGNSIPWAAGKNESPVHFDFICDLADGGEVRADGKPIWRSGSFLESPVLVGPQ